MSIVLDKNKLIAFKGAEIVLIDESEASNSRIRSLGVQKAGEYDIGFYQCSKADTKWLHYFYRLVLSEDMEVRLKHQYYDKFQDNAICVPEILPPEDRGPNPVRDIESDIKPATKPKPNLKKSVAPATPTPKIETQPEPESKTAPKAPKKLVAPKSIKPVPSPKVSEKTPETPKLKEIAPKTKGIGSFSFKKQG